MSFSDEKQNTTTTTTTTTTTVIEDDDVEGIDENRVLTESDDQPLVNSDFLDNFFGGILDDDDEEEKPRSEKSKDKDKEKSKDKEKDKEEWDSGWLPSQKATPWSIGSDQAAMKKLNQHMAVLKSFQDNEDMEFEQLLELYRKNGFDGSVHENENEQLKDVQFRKQLMGMVQRAVTLTLVKRSEDQQLVVQCMMAEGFKTTGCLAAHLMGIQDAVIETEDFLIRLEKHVVQPRKPLKVLFPCENAMSLQIKELDLTSDDTFQVIGSLLGTVKFGLSGAYACDCMCVMELPPAIDLTFADLYSCAEKLNSNDVLPCLDDMGAQVSKWGSVWGTVVPGVIGYGGQCLITFQLNQARNELVQYVRNARKKKTSEVSKPDPIDITLRQFVMQRYVSAPHKIVMSDANAPQGQFIGLTVTASDGKTYEIVGEDWPPPKQDDFDGDGTTVKFSLNFAALPGGMKVTVGGTEAKGWRFDDDDGAIIFDAAPEEGAKIVVTYGTLNDGSNRILHLA